MRDHSEELNNMSKKEFKECLNKMKLAKENIKMEEL